MSWSSSHAMSTANYLETAIVIDSSRDPIVSRQVDHLVAKARLVLEPVTAEQAQVARAACRDFGKGSGHPAQLNFGDCFAYALAKCTGSSPVGAWSSSVPSCSPSGRGPDPRRLR